MLDEPVTEPVRRLIAKYESRIERLEKANGRLCEQINAMPEIVLCRDCVHFEMKKVRYSSKPIFVCIAEWCEGSEGDNPLVNPDGFCAWAKRKEDGDD